MVECELNLRVPKSFLRRVDAEDIGCLRHLVERTLELDGIASKVELSLILAGDEKVRKLNRRYRGIDRTTDVLAFHFQGGGKEGFVSPPNGVLHLGDVVVSLPQAERQAQERGHPLKKELALLVVHGVLHLLGYDHEEPSQARRMRAREAKVLDTEGLKGRL